MYISKIPSKPVCLYFLSLLGLFSAPSSFKFFLGDYGRKRPKTCDERNNFFPFKKAIRDHKLQFFQCPISQWLRPDDLLPKTSKKLLKIKRTRFAFDSKVVGNGILERLYFNPGEIQNSNWHRICLGSRPWIVWKLINSTMFVIACISNTKLANNFLCLLCVRYHSSC